MKKTIIRFVLLTSGIAFFSSVASAQAGASASGGISSLADLVKTINTTLLSALSTLFMSAALVAFFYGVVQYIWGAREGNDKKIKDGNQFMLWGIIALFVMFSIYGFIKFGQGILFPGQDMNTLTIPRLNVDNGGGGAPGGNPTGGTGSGGTSPGAPDPLGGGGTIPNCTVEQGC